MKRSAIKLLGLSLGLLLLFGAAPLTTHAEAPNVWAVVDKDDAQTVLVDRANVIDLGNGVRQTWVQFSYARKTPEGATSSIGLFHFVRNPDRLRNVQDALFDASGNAIYVRRPEKLEDWSPIPPDSTGKAVIDYVFSAPVSGSAEGK